VNSSSLAFRAFRAFRACRSFRIGALLLPLAVVPVTGCSSPSPSAPESSAPAPAVSAPATRARCGSPVSTGPLPEWARAGFSGDSSMPHVLGDRGDIVAAVFGHPLAVTRPDGSSNKILWVSRPDTPPGDLQITATRDGTTDPVQRVVPGGPGPSIIDLPQPGCWRLTLTWSGHTDTLDLTYQP
jgi:hypothetical protein